MKTSGLLQAPSQRESFSLRPLNHISRLITLQIALIGKLPVLTARLEVWERERKPERERKREMCEIIIPRFRNLISLSLFSVLTCAASCVRRSDLGRPPCEASRRSRSPTLLRWDIYIRFPPRRRKIEKLSPHTVHFSDGAKGLPRGFCLVFKEVWVEALMN